LKTLFLERGGIGDLLFRIPYYHRFLDGDSAILCSQRDAEVLRFFLPDGNIITYNHNWFLANPFYRRQILKKAGAPVKKLVISTPYYHEKTFRIAEKIPSEKKIAIFEGGRIPDGFTPRPEFTAISGPAGAHYSETVAALFDMAGFELPPNYRPYEFFRKWRAENVGVTGEEKLAVLQPDAGVYGKRWPEENWREIAKQIVPNYKISVVGETAPDLGQPNAKDGLSRGIAAAFSETLKASMFIGNDTGFTHLAYLAGIPTVFIAGGGEYGRFCPWPGYNETYGHTVEWVFSPMDCFGCGWDCRWGDYRKITPPCIKNISADAVLEALERLKPPRNYPA
jgi:hypothetical protein